MPSRQIGIEKCIGSGLFVGYCRVAPATLASILALIIWWLLIPQIYWVQAIIISFIFFYGVVLSRRLISIWGEDPQRVVIDEICGMFVTLFLLPKSFKTFIIGFLLFRFFDIVKPFPIRRSQKLKVGWGVMIDDLIAGIYSNILIRLIVLGGYNLTS